MATDRSFFKYNIRWIERTFTSRSTTEALLSPEREAGNISPNDYEAATNFLPGFHRHFRVIGGLSAFPLTYAFRKPGWSSVRTFLFLSTASLSGFLVGHVISLSAHLNFIRTIENPAGFSQAMENIQKDVGGIVPPGTIIMRRKGKWAINHDYDHESSPLDGSATGSSDATTPLTTATPTKLTSRWDEIRITNAGASNDSSWDALRQIHERARMDNPGIAKDDSDGERSDDRVAEQAKFDALLDGGRNIR